LRASQKGKKALGGAVFGKAVRMFTNHNDSAAAQQPPYLSAIYLSLRNLVLSRRSSLLVGAVAVIADLSIGRIYGSQPTISAVLASILKVFGCWLALALFLHLFDHAIRRVLQTFLNVVAAVLRFRYAWHRLSIGFRNPDLIPCSPCCCGSGRSFASCCGSDEQSELEEHRQIGSSQGAKEKGVWRWSRSC